VPDALPRLGTLRARLFGWSSPSFAQIFHGRLRCSGREHDLGFELLTGQTRTTQPRNLHGRVAAARITSVRVSGSCCPASRSTKNSTGLDTAQLLGILPFLQRVANLRSMTRRPVANSPALSLGHERIAVFAAPRRFWAHIALKIQQSVRTLCFLRDAWFLEPAARTPAAKILRQYLMNRRRDGGAEARCGGGGSARSRLLSQGPKSRRQLACGLQRPRFGAIAESAVTVPPRTTTWVSRRCQMMPIVGGRAETKSLPAQLVLRAMHGVRAESPRGRRAQSSGKSDSRRATTAVPPRSRLMKFTNCRSTYGKIPP